jgi:4,5-DOPA dioxygenase extradiol
VDEFAAWIHERLDRSDDAALVDYRQQAPAAQRAHPSEEHLLPLFVALGAGGPHCRRERFHAGIDYGVLAMDAYAFRPASHS